FYDHGEAIPGGPPGSAEAEGDRFIEIWNLVFMQYEQLGTGERVPLPRASVDTGMGLERIAAVLQGKHDNYDIDLFRALILASAELLRAQPLIAETLRLEETNFKQTLDRGLRLLEEETARLGPADLLPGEIAFRLYDTYGFPLDLTEDVLRGQGRGVAIEGFEKAMARQREEARKSWIG